MFLHLDYISHNFHCIKEVKCCYLIRLNRTQTECFNNKCTSFGAAVLIVWLIVTVYSKANVHPGGCYQCTLIYTHI